MIEYHLERRLFFGGGAFPALRGGVQKGVHRFIVSNPVEYYADIGIMDLRECERLLKLRRRRRSEGTPGSGQKEMDALQAEWCEASVLGQRAAIDGKVFPFGIISKDVRMRG